MNKKGQEVRYINKSDLVNIRKYFKENQKIVILALINIGVNVGLRISDLSRLRFENINADYTIRLKEKKTKKIRKIKLNSVCQKTIEDLKTYYKEIGFSQEEGFLFKSLNRKYVKESIDKSISTVGISKYLNKARKDLNISYPIGTHSLRKTWGHRVYKGTLDIAIVMTILNHSSANQTLKYIGIEEDKINKIYEKFKI
ncbi:tyrosine-type recombinase/integrase [Fusobacterium ulcerans]|uniref:tyrosine-type recombinase/integrase n=1 Tax=Fusobacterium ulcerans TaxID=861 RepID=UPI001D0BA184|nr:tyrosine-type recombinase/integrase [Fusobacterium ulcerans]MCB8563853.1 tyrosine-type recombinase/integrase [Fusobacterium ulcerans]MCB8648307.1 tyrosine-type recombinase/integrase [Fusobacterium ulcerans]